MLPKVVWTGPSIQSIDTHGLRDLVSGLGAGMRLRDPYLTVTRITVGRPGV